MMKRIFLFLIGSVLLVQTGLAVEDPQAVLYKKDGRAWRVFLVKNGGEELTIRLEKSKANTKIGVADIDRLEIKHPEYDEKQVQEMYNEANYAGVIAALEPIVMPAAEYMGFPNNLQGTFNLLMKAYYENGDVVKAKEASVLLMNVQDSELKLSAQVYRALSALAENDVPIAEAIRAEISDPAAQLYVRACIERATGQPQTAIQTVVELIATHPNDMDWMPLTELLCAELYLEMGLPASAEATARQTQKIYAGTSIEKEAEALRMEIEQLTEQPE